MVEQLRSFVFTYNNFDDSSIFRIRSALDFRYLVVGREVGESGTPHLQGYCQLKSRMRFKKLGKLFPWHIEPCKGSPEQASAYCKKDNDFEEFGTICSESKNGERSQERWSKILTMAQEGRMDLIQSEFPGEYIRNLRQLKQVHVDTMVPNSSNVVSCLWLYGKPGTGKSRFAFDYDRNAYFKNPNKWWDNYQNNKTIVLDDFDKTHAVLGYYLKRWADRYPFLAETKGGSLYPNYSVFIVTSNYRPCDIWDDTTLVEAINRRFKVLEVCGVEESLEGILSIKTPNSLFSYNLLNKFTIFD